MIDRIGFFEELVLMAVGALGDDAYGVAVKEILAEKTGRNPSIGALHSALYRLEDKGLLKSWEGGATTQRGGRRKKFYLITMAGIKVLRNTHDLRMEFGKMIKGLNLGFHES
jgi:DNA-binding PadR family transcriptional regulator